MDERGAKSVVDGSDHPFGFAVLRRSVRAGEAKLHSMLGAKIVKRCIIEFTTIITLKSLNFLAKLCLYIRVKVQEY